MSFSSHILTHIKKHIHPSQGTNVLKFVVPPKFPTNIHVRRLGAVTQHDGIRYLISPIRLKGGKLLSLR